jgi:hypothetical protein
VYYSDVRRATTETGDQIQFQTIVTSDIYNHSWQWDLFVLYAGTHGFVCAGLTTQRKEGAPGRGWGKGKEAKESILATKLMLSAEDWTESNRIISCWAVYVLEPGLCCGLLGLNCGSAGPWQF